VAEISQPLPESQVSYEKTRCEVFLPSDAVPGKWLVESRDGMGRREHKERDGMVIIQHILYGYVWI
jgi:hypothetical protein